MLLPIARFHRAQASHMFLYVLTLVIFILILIFGYKMVQSFKEKSDDLILLKFERDVQATLHSVSYGTTKIRQFDVPSGYREFWLVDVSKAFDHTTVPPTLHPSCAPSLTTVPLTPCAAAPPEIPDAIESAAATGGGKNAFLIGQEKLHAFTLERVSLPKDRPCLCVPITANQLELRLSKG